MRYVIVCVVKGEAEKFNNKLRTKVWEKFQLKSSKLPAHFTIKAPFEYEGALTVLDAKLEWFCRNEYAASFMLDGYDHFDDRVIYMKVKMSEAGKILHDKLIDELGQLPYIGFNKQDGKDKIFHVTVASKKLRNKYEEAWKYVHQYPCKFQCEFDNICIYEWQQDTWKLYKCYALKKDK